MDYNFLRRDVISEVTSAPDTFTSWDKCMSKAYCKWPAIVGIIIGSLILLSVLYCLGRCLCCGVSCAQMLCCCCRGGGGGRSSGRPSRFKDDYAHMPPTPYSGYQPAPSPMAYQQNTGPQVATFDASKNGRVHEDSLPAMPTWDTAPSRRVEEFTPAPQRQNDDVEMGRLQPQPQRRGGYNQVPNGPTSPLSPTYPNQQPGYFAAAPAQQRDYDDDIGVQRMDHTNTPAYHDSRSATMSPAPTYHTYEPENDRFAAGAISPTPQEYNNRGYAPSLQSTQYEATSYANSMQPPQQRQRQYPSTRSQPSRDQYSPTYNYDQQQRQQYHQPQGPHSPTQHDYPPQQTYQQHDSRPESYGYRQQDFAAPQQDQRPPSLLMVGRKPAPGSRRDV